MNDHFEVINIFYKGIIVDETGLPMLNDKEMDAIASFCIFADTRKKAIITKDQTS
jgi:hypothetical protein